MAKVFIENREVPWEVIEPGLRRKIMTWDERLMLVKVEFEKGAIGTPHKHSHTQITHVESGIFDVEIGNERKILTTGDAFYVPPNIVHGVVCHEAGTLVDIFSPMREDFIKKQS
ncbi:MAG: cupin domain-containing protein [Bacteroidetes bacterium]|nr:MAG: cupin domain-containing protein [Bacteroidota bacterium]